ncbi:MAG: methylenetetrahydrofolate reductase [Oligoflexia bacterium]|nr:MAG: methylenetetrahydrofolate reductase [Oligoflexia bacterium]
MEIYKPDLKIIDLLRKQKFTISAEVIPPRNGTAQNEIFTQVSDLIQAGAQFLSVTKGAGGSLRAGSLPIAQAIKDHFKVPAIAHFTCRDLTPEEVENQLMDHHYFGIRNILGLRGDPPTGVSDWSPKPGSYPYAYQLIEQIQNLNQGQFLERTGFQSQAKTKTEFCIGAAAYPDEKNEKPRIDYFIQKIQAGAEYGITQMIYDADSYNRFCDDLAKKGFDIPILPGARILKSQKQADRMRDKFGIHIPDSYYSKLPLEENHEMAIEVFLKFVDKLKSAGAPGLHVFVLVDTQASCEVIKSLKNN